MGDPMNERLLKPVVDSSDHETVLRPEEAAERAKVCCPKRAADFGSGPHLTSETQELLKSRLRAAAVIQLIGFGIFLVRHITGVLTTDPLHPVLLGSHIFVVLVLGVMALPLCRTCTVTLKKLRVSELIIFGLPAVFFLLLQYRVTSDAAERGFMPPVMPFWLLLIFTYALFIPNTWR